MTRDEITSIVANLEDDLKKAIELLDQTSHTVRELEGLVGQLTYSIASLNRSTQ